ncbi:MAG: EAL domain-containing protein [Pseudomonadota bacterium]
MSTILIVDDRPSNRQFLLTLLSFTTHTLLEACDGVQALELARRERPDLIITDILMPTMDGYEFVQQLRADPVLCASRVIFFSAIYSAHETQAMARSCGVRTVLPKPSDTHTIFQAINAELGLTVAAPPDSDPGPAFLSSAPSDMQLLLGGGPDIAELVATYRHGPDPGRLTQELSHLFDQRLGLLHGVAARLTALEELSLRLSGERRDQAMVAVFMQAAAAIVGARYLGLCLLEPDELRVAHLAAFGFDAAVLEPARHDSRSLPGALLEAAEVQRRVVWHGALPGLPEGHPAVKNLLGLPIRDRNHLHGWLYFADKIGADEFGEEDERLALALGAQLAVAYENITLYQVVQRHAAQLQMEASARQQADAALRASEERFRALSTSAPDAIIAVDGEQNMLHFNRAAEAMFGYSEGEVLGQKVTLLIPQRHRDIHNARFAQFDRSHGTYFAGRQEEMTGRKKNGEEFVAEMALSMVSLNGQFLFTAILRDTTARRALEQRLRLSAQIFDSTQESIMMTDADANIVAVNPAFEHITGYAEAEVLGHNPRLLRSGRHDAAFYQAIWDSLDGSGQWRGEIWNRRKNGHVYPERISINVVRDSANAISAYVSVSSDISALTAANDQLDFLSNHHPLTLLPNRAVLSDRLQLAIAAAQHGGHQVALLLFNIDRLQRINDSLGHDAGDRVLREMGRRVSRRLTPGDTLAHLGSDEFVLMLTQCQDLDDVIVAASELVDDVAQPMALDAEDIFVTASVGISIYPRDGVGVAALLTAADVALSTVKESGRNGFRFFTGEMNAHALRWMSLETHLRRALGRDELLLHYQPQVDLGNGRICGMEALLRWHSAELGPISPADFIPLAEDTGLILPIGAWVIHRACSQNKAWQDAGLAPLRVAVNVSARQFLAGTLPAVVRGALDASGLAPQFLEIELTESVMMHDSEATQAQLAELASMGVSISLDDFGTGYSSLGYLSRFTLDKLKIDQSFVRNITTEPRSAAIAQATIALAHGLNLTVVAEGVETEGQLHFLRGIGCDEIQGFLFSRPLPAAEFSALLHEGRTLTREAASPDPEHTLLLLDDDAHVLSALVRLLRRDGYRILVANTAIEAFEMLATNYVQVIISDQRMPGMNGTEFLARVSELYPDTLRMVLSGYTDLTAVTDAINRGAIYKFLSKPWDDDALRETVRDAFRHFGRRKDRRGGVS